MIKASPIKSSQLGFTLIQIMAILGLLGVVLTVATSGYLKHQSTHYIKEALVEAGQARQVVLQNAKNIADESPKDWSKGYQSKTGENHSWNVSIDPSSAAVVVTVWSLKQPATLIWIPVKTVQNKGDSQQTKLGRQVNEGGVDWVCVVKEAELPDASRFFGPLSSNIPTPGFSEELITADCR